MSETGMTNLTAESALESAQELIGRELPECVEDFQQALEFVRLQTRIEAMRDCAREHCEYCGRSHEWPGPTPERRVRRTCRSAYEHCEISRLTAELEKLR